MNRKELKMILKQLDDRPLPDKNKILAACERGFEEQIPRVTVPRIRKKPRRLLLAACLSIALLVSAFSVCAVADEQREYREAVTFFEQHALSTQNLSRKEIKLIYRDIATGSFSYEKTADAISARVGGYEIFQEAPTPEELEALWNYKNQYPEGMDSVSGFDTHGTVLDSGVSYRYSNEVRYSESSADAYSILERYRDGELEWSVTLQSFSVDLLEFSNTHIVLYGMGAEDREIRLLTSDGETLWENDRHQFYSVSSAFVDDGGVTLIGEATNGKFAICSYDLQGKCTQRLTQSYLDMGLSDGSYTVTDAVRVDDGFIVGLTNFKTEEFFIKIDGNANLLGVFTYLSEDEIYYFTDMIEYNGNVWLSGYALQKNGGDTYDASYESALLKETLEASQKRTWTAAELADLVGAQYSAVLMICNPDTGAMQAFYSIHSSLGGELTIDNDGNLVWRVERPITLAYQNIGTDESVYSINGTCTVYAYTFDANGILIGQTNTGESAVFRR